MYVTVSFVFSGILDRLLMEDHQSDCPLPKEMQTAKKALAMAKEFITRYVDMSLPGEESADSSKK